MNLEQAMALFPDPGPITQDIVWLGEKRTVRVRILRAGEEANVLSERAKAGVTVEEQNHQESLSRFGRALVGVDDQDVIFSDDPYQDLQERMRYALEWHEPLIDQIGVAYSRAFERAVTKHPSTYGEDGGFPPMDLFPDQPMMPTFPPPPPFAAQPVPMPPIPSPGDPPPAAPAQAKPRVRKRRP